MAGIDKAAIAFSIAITAIGVGIALVGDTIDLTPTVSTPNISTPPPVSTETSEPEPKPDPFADLAEKVKEDNSKMEEETMMMEEETHEETMMMGRRDS